MKAAVIFDPGNSDGTIGGAELTMQEFAALCPGDLVSLAEAEVVAVGNCVTLPAAETIAALEGKRVIRYHNDLARHEAPDLREWLEQNAEHVFTSPSHQALYGIEGEWPNVPPAVDLAAFRSAAETGERDRGACTIGSWANPGKGQQLLGEWAMQNGPLDVYGAGAFVPEGGNLRRMGELPPDRVAETLARYKTFVHLPTSPEPFGRAVVEAWAAGCELVVNGLIGATHYITEEPEKLETAATDFWALAQVAA